MFSDLKIKPCRDAGVTELSLRINILKNLNFVFDIQIKFVFIYLFLTGVPRETEKEKEPADFDIFDDTESPYSTFNFQYSNEAYTRLHDLMEFNTLNNLEVSSVPVLLSQDPDVEKQKITVVGTSVLFLLLCSYVKCDLKQN